MMTVYRNCIVVRIIQYRLGYSTIYNIIYIFDVANFLDMAALFLSIPVFTLRLSLRLSSTSKSSHEGVVADVET